MVPGPYMQCRRLLCAVSLSNITSDASSSKHYSCFALDYVNSVDLMVVKVSELSEYLYYEDVQR